MTGTMFGLRRRCSARFASIIIAAVLAAAASGAAVADQLDQPAPAVPSAAPPAAPALAEPPKAEGQPAIAPPSGPAVPSSPSAGAIAGPTIAEPVNDMVSVLDTVEALDRPDTDGKALGRIRAGVKIKAIGVVTGGRWVQIELPNQNIAYVRREALRIGAGASEQTSAAPSPETDKVSGLVTAVPDAATLVIGNRTIKLEGIDPGPANVLGGFETWVRSRGLLQCESFAHTGRYRCFTKTGVDVAEAAILNGAGRVGDGASVIYRERETVARTARRGLWAQP